MYRILFVAVTAILLVACTACTQRNSPADAYRHAGPAAITGGYDFGLS